MTDAEWIESFESKQGMGACIVEGQEIAAVVRALEAARRTVSGQEAKPIYQARSINSVTWTDQSKDGYDHMAKYPMCFEVRIVYAAPIPATELMVEEIAQIFDQYAIGTVLPAQSAAQIIRAAIKKEPK
jgi:alkylated DNA repair dioxygenase AlkB